MFGSVLDNTSLCIDYLVESCKITIFLFDSILPNLKVTGGFGSRRRGVAHLLLISSRKIKLRSFKSKEHINEKEVGPYRDLDFIFII